MSESSDISNHLQPRRLILNRAHLSNSGNSKWSPLIGSLHWFPTFLVRFSCSASTPLFLLQTELLTGGFVDVSVLQQTLVWTVTGICRACHRYEKERNTPSVFSHFLFISHSHKNDCVTLTIIRFIQGHGKLGEAILSFPVRNLLVGLPHLLDTSSIWVLPCHALVPCTVKDILHLEGEGGERGGERGRGRGEGREGGRGEGGERGRGEGREGGGGRERERGEGEKRGRGN